MIIPLVAHNTGCAVMGIDLVASDFANEHISHFSVGAKYYLQVPQVYFRMTYLVIGTCKLMFLSFRGNIPNSDSPVGRSSGQMLIVRTESGGHYPRGMSLKAGNNKTAIVTKRKDCQLRKDFMRGSFPHHINFTNSVKEIKVFKLSSY